MIEAGVGIDAIGVASPVGFGWLGACAAMRAGINRKSLSPYRDNQGREIVASYLAEDHVSRQASCEERWSFLLADALAQVATGADGVQELARARLYLALPFAPDDRPQLPTFVSAALSARLGVAIAPERLRLATGASPAGFAALRAAQSEASGGDVTIVAAADSLVSARRLLPLATANRLLVEGNSDGFIPGEAAVALRLSRGRPGSIAEVGGIGLAEEQATLENDLALRADGLVKAVGAALTEAQLSLEELDFRLSDASGESFFFKEQALLLARLMGQPKKTFPLWLSADPLGHTGAAAGLCGIAWACAAWQRDYAPGPRALVTASSDTGERGAVILQRGS